MKIKVYENHWLAKKLNVAAITLYPRIYMSISYQQAEDDNVLNHEFIHVAQVRAQGWLPFYASYLWDYFKLYLKYRNQEEAYLQIPAESAAYAGQASTPHPPCTMVDGVLCES